jgi:hypothetical protein
VIKSRSGIARKLNMDGWEIKHPKFLLVNFHGMRLRGMKGARWENNILVLIKHVLMV